MPGLVGPEHFPIRDPKDPAQAHGRVINPVRFQEMGGLTGEGKWARGNQMEVKRPTRVGSVRTTTRKNED